MATSEAFQVERVRSAVRVRRRLNHSEINSSSQINVDEDPATVVVTADAEKGAVGIRSRNAKGTLEFKVDAAFGEGASQEEVYSYVRPLLRGVSEGINTTIFAYGQTGSGKTYTMLGDGLEDQLLASSGRIGSSTADAEADKKEDKVPGSWGVIPRAVTDIFAQLEAVKVAAIAALSESSEDGSSSPTPPPGYRVQCSYMQIYQDRLYDLLTDRRMENPLPVREQVNYTNPPSVGGFGTNESLEWGNGFFGGNSNSEGNALGSSGKMPPTPQQTALLAPGSSGMMPPPLSATNGEGCSNVYVQGLSERSVGCVDDVLALLRIGARNRAVRSTEYNFHSSRSHAILQLTVEVESVVAEATGAGAALEVGTTTTTTTTTTRKWHRAKLNLIDLAGSEKWGDVAANSKPTAKELTTINTSLSALGNCISALAERPKRRHIPFRDSVLTRLLQDALGGSHRTLVLATVAPHVACLEETSSTLGFATRANRLTARLRPNELLDDAAKLRKANQEIADLKRSLLLAQRPLSRSSLAGDRDERGNNNRRNSSSSSSSGTTTNDDDDDSRAASITTAAVEAAAAVEKRRAARREEKLVGEVAKMQEKIAHLETLLSCQTLQLRVQSTLAEANDVIAAGTTVKPLSPHEWPDDGPPDPSEKAAEGLAPEEKDIEGGVKKGLGEGDTHGSKHDPIPVVATAEPSASEREEARRWLDEDEEEGCDEVDAQRHQATAAAAANIDTTIDNEALEEKKRGDADGALAEDSEGKLAAVALVTQATGKKKSTPASLLSSLFHKKRSTVTSSTGQKKAAEGKGVKEGAVDQTPTCLPKLSSDVRPLPTGAAVCGGSPPGTLNDETFETLAPRRDLEEGPPRAAVATQRAVTSRPAGRGGDGSGAREDMLMLGESGGGAEESDDEDGDNGDGSSGGVASPMAAFTDVESPGVKIGDGELNEDAHRSPRESANSGALPQPMTPLDLSRVPSSANVLVSVKQLQDGQEAAEKAARLLAEESSGSTVAKSERGDDGGEDDGSGVVAKVLYTFRGEEDGDLTVMSGQYLEVLEQAESGWWTGRLVFPPGHHLNVLSPGATDGEGLLSRPKGLFPCHYVELLGEEESRRVFAPPKRADDTPPVAPTAEKNYSSPTKASSAKHADSTPGARKSSPLANKNETEDSSGAASAPKTAAPPSPVGSPEPQGEQQPSGEEARGQIEESQIANEEIAKQDAVAEQQQEAEENIFATKGGTVWQKDIDPATGSQYYYNENKGSQWDVEGLKPAPSLGEEGEGGIKCAQEEPTHEVDIFATKGGTVWQKDIDPATGSPYYYNENKGSQWDVDGLQPIPKSPEVSPDKESAVGIATLKKHESEAKEGSRGDGEFVDVTDLGVGLDGDKWVVTDQERDLYNLTKDAFYSSDGMLWDVISGGTDTDGAAYFLDVLSGATQWEDPREAVDASSEDKLNVDVDSGVTIPTALHNLKVARRDQIKSSKADEDEESNRINGSKEGKETGGKAEVGNEKKAGGVRELDAIAAAAAAASSAAAAAMAEYSGSSASTSPRASSAGAAQGSARGSRSATPRESARAALAAAAAALDAEAKTASSDALEGEEASTDVSAATTTTTKNKKAKDSKKSNLLLTPPSPTENEVDWSDIKAQLEDGKNIDMIAHDDVSGKHVTSIEKEGTARKTKEAAAVPANVVGHRSGIPRARKLPAGPNPNPPKRKPASQASAAPTAADLTRLEGERRDASNTSALAAALERVALAVPGSTEPKGTVGSSSSSGGGAAAVVTANRSAPASRSSSARTSMHSHGSSTRSFSSAGDPGATGGSVDPSNPDVAENASTKKKDALLREKAQRRRRRGWEDQQQASAPDGERDVESRAKGAGKDGAVGDGDQHHHRSGGAVKASGEKKGSEKEASASAEKRREVHRKNLKAAKAATEKNRRALEQESSFYAAGHGQMDVEGKTREGRISTRAVASASGVGRSERSSSRSRGGQDGAQSTNRAAATRRRKAEGGSSSSSRKDKAPATSASADILGDAFGASPNKSEAGDRRRRRRTAKSAAGQHRNDDDEEDEDEDDVDAENVSNSSPSRQRGRRRKRRTASSERSSLLARGRSSEDRFATGRRREDRRDQPEGGVEPGREISRASAEEAEQSRVEEAQRMARRRVAAARKAKADERAKELEARAAVAAANAGLSPDRQRTRRKGATFRPSRTRRRLTQQQQEEGEEEELATEEGIIAGEHEEATSPTKATKGNAALYDGVDGERAATLAEAGASIRSPARFSKVSNGLGRGRSKSDKSSKVEEKEAAAKGSSTGSPTVEPFAAEKGIRMVDQRKVKAHPTSEQANGTSKVMVDQRQAIQSKREAVHRKQQAMLRGGNGGAMSNAKVDGEGGDRREKGGSRATRATASSRRSGMTDEETSKIAANKEVSRRRAEAAAERRAKRSGAKSSKGRKEAPTAATNASVSPTKQLQKIAEAGRMLRPGEFTASASSSSSSSGVAGLGVSPSKGGGHVVGQAVPQVIRATAVDLVGESAWRNLFFRQDRDGSGLMTRGELGKVVRRVLGISPKVLDEQQLTKLFRSIDVAGDGEVDIAQLVDVVDKSESGAVASPATKKVLGSAGRLAAAEATRSLRREPTKAGNGGGAADASGGPRASKGSGARSGAGSAFQRKPSAATAAKGGSSASQKQPREKKRKGKAMDVGGVGTEEAQGGAVEGKADEDTFDDFFGGQNTPNKTRQQKKGKASGHSKNSKITWLHATLDDLSSPQLGDESGVRELKEQVRQLSSSNLSPGADQGGGAPFPALLGSSTDGNVLPKDASAARKGALGGSQEGGKENVGPRSTTRKSHDTNTFAALTSLGLVGSAPNESMGSATKLEQAVFLNNDGGGKAAAKCDRHGLENCVLCSLATTIGNVAGLRLDKGAVDLSKVGDAAGASKGRTSILPSVAAAAPPSDQNSFLARFAAKSFAGGGGSSASDDHTMMGGGPCARHGLEKCVLCSGALPSIGALSGKSGAGSSGAIASYASPLLKYKGSGVVSASGGGASASFSAASILARSATETTTAKAGGDSSKLAGGPCAKHGLEGCFLCSLAAAPMQAGLLHVAQATTGGTAGGSSALLGSNSTPVLSQQSGGGGGGGGGGATSPAMMVGPGSTHSGFGGDDQSSDADEEEYRRVSIAEAERRGERNPSGSSNPNPSPYLAQLPGSTAALSAPRTRRGSKSGKTGGAGPRSPPTGGTLAPASNHRLRGGAPVSSTEQGPGSALSWSVQGRGRGGQGSAAGARIALASSAQSSDFHEGFPAGSGSIAQEALRAAQSILTDGPS